MSPSAGKRAFEAAAGGVHNFNKQELFSLQSRISYDVPCRCNGFRWLLSQDEASLSIKHVPKLLELVQDDAGKVFLCISVCIAAMAHQC